jgi:cation transport protein ChaC
MMNSLRVLIDSGNFEEIENLEELWVFGYGSLVWLPNFEFSEKCVGKITGWDRRFYQGNSTHRGMPGRPGRVATLLRGSGETHGSAYRLSGRKQVQSALAHLNMRESTLGGYVLEVEMFYCDKSNRSFPVLLYTATPENSQFTGTQSIAELAKIIAFSTGPSGTNREYLFRLVDWQRQNLPNVKDDHLYELEKATRFIISQKIEQSLLQNKTPRRNSILLQQRPVRINE